MTKIAHRNNEHDQDGAVVPRNDAPLTRMARATAKVGADAARESAQVARTTADAAEDLQETTLKLAKESPELNRAFVELVQAQTRQSMDTLGIFARAVNWTDVAQAQSKLMTSSILRIGQFNARYGELLLRRMTAAPALSRK